MLTPFYCSKMQTQTKSRKSENKPFWVLLCFSQIWLKSNLQVLNKRKKAVVGTNPKCIDFWIFIVFVLPSHKCGRPSWSILIRYFVFNQLRTAVTQHWMMRTYFLFFFFFEAKNPVTKSRPWRAIIITSRAIIKSPFWGTKYGSWWGGNAPFVFPIMKWRKKARRELHYISENGSCTGSVLRNLFFFPFEKLPQPIWMNNVYCYEVSQR